MKDALNRHGALKVYAVISVKFIRIFNGEENIASKSFIAKTHDVFATTLLDDWFKYHVKQPILRDVKEFEENAYIDFPQQIKRKQACVNIKNLDNQCFEWVILSAMHPVDRRDKNDRVSKYKKRESEFNFPGIDFPVALKDVAKFEQQNNISVNVYALTRNNWKFNAVSLHLTSHKREIHVDLLRVEDHYINEYHNPEDYDDDEGIEPLNFHYVCTTNLSRLINNKFSSNRHRNHICDRCRHRFISEIKLVNHETDCKKMKCG